MIRICEQCHKEYRTPPSKAKKFCSHNCYFKYKIGKECPFKGKKIGKHKSHNLSEEGRRALVESNKRRNWKTPEAKEKMKNRRKPAWIFLRGRNNPNWKEDKIESQRNIMLRKTVRYKEWRKAVFERDCYTCQECGDKKGGNLEAHHIKSFSKYSRLRFNLSNGLTLCTKCHKKTDNWGNKNI